MSLCDAILNCPQEKSNVGLDLAFVKICHGTVLSGLRSVFGRDLDEEIKGYYSGEINSAELRNPELFDALSYAIHKSVAVCLDEEVSKGRMTEEASSKTIEFLTLAVGEEIYAAIEKEGRLMLPQGYDDVAGFQRNIGVVMDYFKRVGYVTNAYVRWDVFDEARWREHGTASFIYGMENPVILPSAQKLFRQHGFGQHISSRTIQRALVLFQIDGQETKDFDPNEFNMSAVEEMWNLKKIYQ